MQYGKTLISRQNLQTLLDCVFTNHLLDGQQLDNYNVFAIDDELFATPRESKRKGILLMLSRAIGCDELENDAYFEMRVDLGRKDGRGKRIKIKRVENPTTAFETLNSVYRVETQIFQMGNIETPREATRLFNEVWGSQYVHAHERAEYDENPHFFDLSLWSSHYDPTTKNLKKIVIGFVMCKKNPNYIGRNVPTDNAPTAHAETMELETAE